MKFFLVLLGVAFLCLAKAEIQEDFDKEADPVSDPEFDKPLKTDPKFDEFLKEYQGESDEPLKPAVSKFTEALQADPKLQELITASDGAAEDEDETVKRRSSRIHALAIAYYARCAHNAWRHCFRRYIRGYYCYYSWCCEVCFAKHRRTCRTRRSCKSCKRECSHCVYAYPKDKKAFGFCYHQAFLPCYYDTCVHTCFNIRNTYKALSHKFCGGKVKGCYRHCAGYRY